MPKCRECGEVVEYSFLADDGAMYANPRSIPQGTEGVIVCPKCIAFVGEPFAYAATNWDDTLEAVRRANQPAPERPAVTVWCQSCEGQIAVDVSVITRVHLEASARWSGRPGTFTVHASSMRLSTGMRLRCPHCGREGEYTIISEEVRRDLQQVWNQ
jgi:hypothetical protein